MKNLLPMVFFGGLSAIIISPAVAQDLTQALTIVYPPANYETSSTKIFLIGSAPVGGPVLVNGKPIDRSATGHFAPSFPLQVGANTFTVVNQGKTVELKITRTSPLATATTLQPSVDIARLPGESICLSATAMNKASVSATIGPQTIPLTPQTAIALPENNAVLTGNAQVAGATPSPYMGCLQFERPIGPQTVNYTMTASSETKTVIAPGKITILNPVKPEVVAVSVDAGVARTGASTDFSRLSPLPKGTRASVTGQEGEWLRLDYGGWIKRSETTTIPNAIPPRSIIRGVTSRLAGDWTEVVFPLQVPMPTAIQQDGTQLILSIFNTTAQTDTIKVVTNPTIDLVNWQQTNPNQIDYRFNLKSAQQWGYKLRYEGTNLILSVKNPPPIPKSSSRSSALKGIKILLDPGHGGPEDSGSVGPTGYPEKDATLYLSKLLRDRLTQMGATVIMTREGDIDLLPNDRNKLITQIEPTIALSIHFNALPDNGDAIRTSGMSAFWYQPQARDLANFLQRYVTQKLDRKSDGVFWNNLAVTRPATAPSVLLEMGYMINPVEFEWIRDPKAQQKAADTLADGILAWFESNRRV
jgi:N-acetylmuramoyl-L-alanine amidase